MLTSEQIQEISKIIKEHFGAIIYLFTGKTSPDVSLKALKRKGIVGEGTTLDTVSDAYVYGLLSAINSDDLKGKSVPEIIDWIKRIPLSEMERSAVDWLATNSAEYCQGLGNRVDAATKRVIYDSTREASMLGQIKETLADKVKQRKTRKEIITALRDATGDVHRDWQRIVNTELHQAYTFGVSKAINDHFGEDSTVIVRPFADCCDLCRDAYLGKDGLPKVFKLKDLASRTNVGRKVAEIRKVPGLPPAHPHCFCTVHYFNRSIHEFDKQGRIVLKKKPSK